MEGAVDRALDVGDRRNAAYARNVLAHLSREQGEFDRAAALYQESLAAFEEVEDRFGMCNALLGIADVARDQGKAEGVIPPSQRALAVGREIGDPFTVGYALNNLGLAALTERQYPRAEALLEQSLTVFTLSLEQSLSVFTLWGEARATILCSLGLVALDQRQYDRAEETFAESLRIVNTEFVGSRIRTLLKGLAGLAGVAVGRGQPQRAAQLLGAAEALRAAIGTPIQPVNRRRYERDVAAARAALGEERFKALWDEGRAMTQEQSIAFALDELPSTDE